MGRNYREELSGGIRGGGGGMGGVGSWAARPRPGREMEGWMDDWRSSWGGIERVALGCRRTRKRTVTTILT